MAVYHDVQHGNYVERPAVNEPTEHGMNVLARVISLIGGIIIGLVGLRFLFILLGANPLNGFVNFIYDVSRPFVQPFYGMFNTEATFTKAHFELASLIAIIVYALLTLLLVKLATLGRHRSETY
jgi:YggT family protein